LLTNSVSMFWIPVNTAENKGSGESNWDIRTKDIINITDRAVENKARSIDCSSHFTANLAA